MLTTSHGIIGYFLQKKKGKKIWIFSVIGAITPDIPMILSVIVFYVFSFFKGFSNELSHNILHEQFIDIVISPILHSIFLWIIIGYIALIFKNKLTKSKILALSLGGISHIVIDFFTHQGKWTWNHFYPLDFPPVEGIIYYLDPYFIVIINSLWIILFGPKIYKYFKNKNIQGD